MSGRCNFFTLIELMVVLAIIMIMTAMVLPALARARETAKRCGCRSNLHQIGLALQLYADDNHELLPATASGLKNLINYRYVNPKIFLCPADKKNRISNIDCAYINRDNSVSASYSFVNHYRAPERDLSMRIHHSSKTSLEWDLYGGSWDSVNRIKRNHGIEGGNVLFFDLHTDWRQRSLWFRPNKPLYIP